MDLRRAEELVHDLSSRAGVPDSWGFEWSFDPNFPLGLTQLDNHRIIFNAPAFVANDERLAREATLHESAHVLVGPVTIGDPHGRVWQEEATRLGCIYTVATGQFPSLPWVRVPDVESVSMALRYAYSYSH